MSGQTAEIRPDLRVPSHGRGLLRQPWDSEAARKANPGGRAGEYREMQRLAKEASPAAMRKTIKHMDSADERVSLLACQTVMDRAHGKVRERPPEDEAPRTMIDISRLGAEDKALLRRLFASGAIRTEGDSPPTEIEGKAE